MNPEPNALDALASVGAEIARYGAFLLFVAAVAAWWWIAA